MIVTAGEDSVKLIPMQTNGEFYSDKLMDLANFAMVALVFEQVGKGGLKMAVLLTASAFFFGCFMISFIIRKREKRKYNGSK